ncbi:hypothetical protein [Rhodococcoides fascians]|uniref:Glycine zipper family protein n=1 Tax=Rhodococcoides fascians TaxID=1828 RepID=A0A143QM05_RHOFA|nr:hypothetical protein [Rhodococcus fascians]AMY23407.1 hypothetical protein A3Q41_02105 [Rhodococcus fascians]OZC38940.1 hypothetical protein CHX23_20360 [Rhodococcus fascians]
MADNPQKPNAGMYVLYGVVAGMLAGVIVGVLIDNLSIGIGGGMFLGALVSSAFIARMNRPPGSGR